MICDKRKVLVASPSVTGFGADTCVVWVFCWFAVFWTPVFLEEVLVVVVALFGLLVVVVVFVLVLPVVLEVVVVVFFFIVFDVLPVAGVGVVGAVARDDSVLLGIATGVAVGNDRRGYTDIDIGVGTCCA